ncbi:hypothetical protein [Spirosoma sp.]|uniref:hypothetical protein n=1 Tax=Spirosoma sp. TaxID=1899569 RepID=UPI003B3BE2F2
MEKNGVSDADYIRSKLDDNKEVRVRKIDNGETMTAYGYDSEETSIGSISNRDAIKCKWKGENGVEWDDVFNIYAFERAESN